METSMEDINDSITQLKAVYKAQSEAYVEFNTALINMLSYQKEILNKVENLKIFSEDEFKKITANFNHLERNLTSFNNSQKRRDEKIEGFCESFTSTMNSLNSGLESVSKELKTVKSLQWDVKNSWNKVLYILGGIFTFVTLIQLITGKGVIDWFK
jgi:hypothetical protein